MLKERDETIFMKEREEAKGHILTAVRIAVREIFGHAGAWTFVDHAGPDKIEDELNEILYRLVFEVEHQTSMARYKETATAHNKLLMAALFPQPEQDEAKTQGEVP